MASGQAGKGMGAGTTAGHKGSGKADPSLPEQNELGSQMQGNNQLQGNDQKRVHNERQSMPGERQETEGVVESFENMDPKRRAGG